MHTRGEHDSGDWVREAQAGAESILGGERARTYVMVAVSSREALVAVRLVASKVRSTCQGAKTAAKYLLRSAHTRNTC